MAGNRRERSISWPFAPTTVRLNEDTGLLKLVAMLAMLCDHMGKMLFPQYPIMRIIGRIAFPIYAYCLAVGCVYTRNPLNYLKRILLLALISQPLYAIALAHTNSKMFAVSFSSEPLHAALNFYLYSWTSKPSILCTLAMGIILIWALRNKQIIVFLATMLFCWLVRNQLDYGLKGIVLMLIFYIFCSRRWLSLPIVLAFMLWWGIGSGSYSLFGVRFGTQAFAIFALPLIYVHTNTGVRLPKWTFYAFYPAHLALIYALNTFVQ